MRQAPRADAEVSAEAIGIAPAAAPGYIFPRSRTTLLCRIESITADQFHLPTLAPFLSSVQHELVEGRGFALLKGLPVHRYSTRC